MKAGWLVFAWVACAERRVTPSPTVAASAPTVEVAAVDASVPMPIDSSLPAPGLAAWTPQLLARLAKEADAQPVGKLNLPSPDAARDQAIAKAYGDSCHLERTCGPIWGVDCGAAADGPYFYLRPRVDRIEALATCGGACMGNRCTNCPPRLPGWSCRTY